jgi:protease-4
VVALVVIACFVVLAGLGGVLFYKMAGLLADGPPSFATVPETKFNEEVVQPARHGSSDRIAIVDVKGIIIADARFDAASSKRIVAQLKAARRDPTVVAVILDMNTPGGEVTASDEIHHAVAKVREAGKPVVTCMHAMGASGGYLVAAGTDFIIANRLTLTGSVGVIVGTLNYADLFEKHGLETEVYKSGELKDFLHGGRKRTDAEKDLIQQLIDSHFREFAQIIADGRSQFETVEDVMAAEFADGRVLAGAQALEAGLVDQEGYFEDAVEKTRELAHAPGAALFRYRQPLRLTDLLFSMQSSRLTGLGSLLPAEARLLKPGHLYFLLPSVVP